MSPQTLALVPQYTQPENETVVWQHNSLAQARYSLTAREQKVLLYVISMIESQDDELKLYRIRIEDFARLVKLRKDDLYQELREIVSQLKSKPLVIQNHFEPGDNKPKTLLTSWFADVVTDSDGSGYIGVSISNRLKPYLLQVKREFFRYQLGYAIELRSAYALRLYQWAKRWQFSGKRLISVAELRTVMGAEELDPKGRVMKELLPRYANFHQSALRPSVKEINTMTDVRLSYAEQKTPGTKRVEALLFRISPNACADGLLAPMPEGNTAQSELPFSNGDEEYLGEIKNRFALSGPQVLRLRAVVAEHGIDYVKTKVELVTNMEPDNGARALLAALRDDWQKPKKVRKPAPRRTVAQPMEPVMTPEEWVASQQTVKDQVDALRRQVNWPARV
jgi:plasmid replication initiation protein